MNASVLKGAAILIFAGAMSVMTGCGGNQQQAPQGGAPAYATMVLTPTTS